MLYNILLIVEVIVAIGIIGLVLIQHGKGADAGAAFGSGASNTLFGSKGAGNFLSRSTAMLAVVFFANSMALAWMVSNRSTVATSVTDSLVAPATDQKTVPSDVPSDSSSTGSDLPAAGQSDVPAAAPVQSDIPAAPAATQSDVPAAAPATQDVPVADVPAAETK